MSKEKREKHSSICDSCGEALETPYLSDITYLNDEADEIDFTDSDETDIHVKCRNCDEGYLWLRLRVEPLGICEDMLPKRKPKVSRESWVKH